MKAINKLTVYAGILLALCACDNLDIPRQTEGIRLPITVSCEPLDTESDTVTKSTHRTESLKHISTLNYYLFKDGKLVGHEYFSDKNDFSVLLPSDTEDYNLYLLVNVGNIQIEEDTSESDMETAVHVDYRDRSTYMSLITKHGFPMAAKVTGFNAGSIPSFTLKRLVHTLYINAGTSGLSTTRMTFTGVSIRQAPRDIFPFAEESRALYTIDGDAADLSGEDIRRLNNGETITLYLLENMRGTLIPGNTDWKAKVPRRISSLKDRLSASYIELKAKAQTATAFYKNNIYRAYIGSSPSDFNAKRSTYFTMNNHFTNDMIIDEEWRIESSEPAITAELKFVDGKFVSASSSPEDTSGVSEFFAMRGFTSVYYIYRSNPDIRYRVSVDKDASVEPYVEYEIAQINDNYAALIVDTRMPLSGYYPHDTDESSCSTKDVTFKLTSADGLITDRLTCRVLHKHLGIRFKYEGGTNEERLNMYMFNPMKAGVAVNLNAELYGEVDYKPNGTWGKDAYKYDTQTMETVYSDIPVSGQASPVDQYKINSDGILYPSSGLNMLFKAIWNKTVWDSTNKLNDNEGYYKHYIPNFLIVDISMKYHAPDRILHNCPSIGNQASLNTLPIHIENKEISYSGTSYSGGGTDWGFRFRYHKITGAASYADLVYNQSYYSWDPNPYDPFNVPQRSLSVVINDEIRQDSGGEYYWYNPTSLKCEKDYSNILNEIQKLREL